MKNYGAPWSTSLIAMSSFTTLLLAGVAIATAVYGHVAVAWLCGLILFGSAPFTILGYRVTPRDIEVRRLFWTTRLPLAGLESAAFDPAAMNGSVRLFGNGGLFSFTGLFRSRSLGSYRAYVTDPRRAVVLRFPARTVVVSPADPRDFVQALTPNRSVR